MFGLLFAVGSSVRKGPLYPCRPFRELKITMLNLNSSVRIVSTTIAAKS
jgi:hypothetical protein